MTSSSLAKDQVSAMRYPPRVTTSQWILAIGLVLLAWYSDLFGSREELAAFALLLAVVNILLLLDVSKEALRTRSLGKVLLVGSVLFFYWFDALQLGFEKPPFAVPARLPVYSGQFHKEIIKQAYSYVTLFQLMLLVGYSVRPRMHRLVPWVCSRVDSASGSGRLLRYLLVSCALVPLLVSYGFNLEVTIDALLAARSGGPAAEDIGLLHYLYFLGMYGAAFLLAEAIVFSDWKQTLSRTSFFLIGAVGAVPFIMLWGTRHLWLFIALPACILLLTHSKGRITLPRALTWGTILATVFLVAQLQLALRLRGWEEIGTIGTSELFERNPSGQFVALLFAELLVPDFHNYFREPVEPYFLIHWIPRRLWQGKPTMALWEYYNEAYTRGAAFNVTPSVIGQFHMNYGVIGVIFIGVWLGFLACLADRLLLAIDLDRQRAVAISIGMFHAFILSSFRFYSPVYFTYFVFALIGTFLITRKQSLGRSGLVSDQPAGLLAKQASLRPPLRSPHQATREKLLAKKL